MWKLWIALVHCQDSVDYVDVQKSQQCGVYGMAALFEFARSYQYQFPH